MRPSRHPCCTGAFQAVGHEKRNPAKQQVLSSSSAQLDSPPACPQCWATRQHLQDTKLHTSSPVDHGWIVELCHNPLIQTFLFLISGLNSSLWHRAIPSGWRRHWFRLAQSHLVHNLSAMPQIRRKDQPILAPPQRTVGNTEFFLNTRFGSDHPHLFLSVAPIFAMS